MACRWNTFTSAEVASPKENKYVVVVEDWKFKTKENEQAFFFLLVSVLKI